MKKTIFITSFHALISRNILSTGILPLLVKEGFRIVILVPKMKEVFFKNAFESSDVIIEGVDYSFGKRELFLRYLSLASLNTVTLRIKRKTEMEGSGSVLTHFISNRIGRKIVRYIEQYSYRHNIFGNLFTKYKPQCVFTTDVQNEFDIALVNEAKRKNIKHMGMVRSWDNLTSKGLIRSVPQELVVWNEIIQNEAVELNGIPKSTISIVGIPHYDEYYKANFVNKEEFFKKIGGDYTKKLALVIPIGDRYLKNNTVDKDIVQILTEILPDDYQILVRLPPGDYVRALENNIQKFEHRHVMYDRARVPFESIKMTELLKEDDEHLIQTLYWSNLVISGPSTVAIDAVFLNKPVVLFGFDGYDNREYFDSIRRYYDYNNFTHVTKSGGVQLAKTEDEFKKYINAYISDPKKDDVERVELAKLEAGFLDGKSIERLVALISRTCK